MADKSPVSGKRSGRWVYFLAVAIFLGYAAWVLGPYIRSVVVRDAAVTTWLHKATSPIDGAVALAPVAIGEMIGADGIIVEVRNERVSRHELFEVEIRTDLAAARVTWLQDFIASLKLYDRGRADLKSDYADSFRAELDTTIAGLEREITAMGERLALMRKIANSRSTLVEKGWAAQLLADEEAMRVSALELQIVEMRVQLDRARQRRLAADNGVFMSEDGGDPAWVRGTRIELKLQKEHARMELKEAMAELDLARAALSKAEQDFEKLSHGTVSAPPGSVVWSLRVASGAAVRAGDVVAHWLDRSILLIDVPVSDAEVSLIKTQMEADVVLEGETVTRPARVVLTRGSASTLGAADLAARAKGRRDGIAQVLLELTEARDQIEDCPVGRAAFVDFPDVGFLDVLRARLRF